MRQIAATVPFLVRSVMTWERGHPARISRHFHPVPIFHPAQVLHYVCVSPASRKRARCPRSQGFQVFHCGQDARAPRFCMRHVLTIYRELIRDCGQLWIVAPGKKYGITSEMRQTARRFHSLSARL